MEESNQVTELCHGNIRILVGHEDPVDSGVNQRGNQVAALPTNVAV